MSRPPPRIRVDGSESDTSSSVTSSVRSTFGTRRNLMFFFFFFLEVRDSSPPHARPLPHRQPRRRLEPRRQALNLPLVPRPGMVVTPIRRSETFWSSSETKYRR